MKVDAVVTTLYSKVTLQEDNYTSERISTAYAKDCMLKCMCLNSFWTSLVDTYSYICLNPLSNEQKSMVESGDSHAVWTWVWIWKYLKWALHYLHEVIYRKSCGPDWSFRRCFCSRKGCLRLWRCDYVMMFESLQVMPFCLEKSSVRKWTS